MEVCHDARASAWPMMDNLGCGPVLGVPPPVYEGARDGDQTTVTDDR